MVAIVKAVLASGHAKPYRPIDLKLLPPNLPYPRVEPGRIEVRMRLYSMGHVVECCLVCVRVWHGPRVFVVFLPWTPPTHGF